MTSRLLACLALVFALAPTPAVLAQSRAYAPENLGQLSARDQTRVIEQEYREQSGGRPIPDDQLDFYLDQVRYSRWTFSQVRNDIAQSLRGSQGGWRPPSNGNWRPREVICTSVDRQYRECRTPFRGPAQLSYQISDTRCVEGRNWGSRPGLIWVDNGCRARFSEARPSWPGWGGAAREKVLCESRDNRYQQCNTDFRGAARISQQLSDAACIEGRSWGQAQGLVWVSRGCRAWFEDSRWNGGYPGGNSSYSVTCSSTDKRRQTCAWDDRRGWPRLVEQLSDTRCSEGRNWGYSNGALWVDDGCRGRFAPR